MRVAEVAAVPVARLAGCARTDGAGLGKDVQPQVPQKPERVPARIPVHALRTWAAPATCTTSQPPRGPRLRSPPASGAVAGVPLGSAAPTHRVAVQARGNVAAQPCKVDRRPLQARRVEALDHRGLSRQPHPRAPQSRRHARRKWSERKVRMQHGRRHRPGAHKVDHASIHLQQRAGGRSGGVGLR